jgi:hypothetical protein
MSLEKVFERAVTAQPFIGRLKEDVFRVDSITNPDRAYNVFIPEGDITKAECDCVHYYFQRNSPDYEKRVCVHIASAFIVYYDLYNKASQTPSSDQALANCIQQVKNTPRCKRCDKLPSPTNQLVGNGLCEICNNDDLLVLYS